MSYDNEGVPVSKFDYSVENHFKAMDKIGLIDDESLIEYDETEIQRLSSSVTFLRKWRDFCYQPRDIRFDCESKTPQEKDVTGRISLPQFSSAAVPKMQDWSDGNESTSPLSKDFVMFVGGHVWALDWCPRVHQSSDYDCNVEFIAVSAHPPESSYHVIGAPLSGRGLIQIWCILNTGVKDQDVTSLVKVKSRKYTKNKEAKKPKDNEPKRPRGRPRKTPLSEIDGIDQLLQDISVQSSENSNKLLQLVVKADTNKPKRPRERPRKKPIKQSVNNTDNSPEPSAQPLALEFPDQSPNLLDVYKNDPFIPETVTKEDFVSNKLHEHVTKKEYIVYKRRPKSYKKEETLKSMLTSIKSKLKKCTARKKSLVNADNLPLQQNLALEPVQTNDSISEDVALPRLVMGLAHNGKVAWDVKWKPIDSHNISKHRMGYLAVLLGSGALEVWEIPLPRATKAIFSSCETEGADPRFVKLKPVFMCSMLKCGNIKR
nr:hypothetical protein [Tanacetum cinerariifolium]